MTPVRLEPLAPPSQVKHSTTALPNLMWKAVNVLKLEIRTANREDPDQTASEKQPDLGQRCLSRQIVGQLVSCQPRVTVMSYFVYKVIRDLESIGHLMG